MKTIEVCVGSSCHLKGAYSVVDQLTKRIEQDGLKDRIRIEGCFCLDSCQHGVAVRIGDRIFSAQAAGDVEEILHAALED